MYSSLGDFKEPSHKENERAVNVTEVDACQQSDAMRPNQQCLPQDLLCIIGYKI